MTTTAAEFVVKTTLYHRSEYFGVSPRAMPNLNNIAEAFVIKRSHTPTTALSAAEISLLADIDRTHALKLLKNRPGFTKVVRLDGRSRSVGWYYHQEFLEAARRQGSGFYPENNTLLAYKPWPLEQVLSSTDAVGDKQPTVDNVKLEEIKYDGVYPTRAPMLVDIVEFTEDQVKKAYTNRHVLLGAIDAHTQKYAEAIRKGEKYDTTSLHEQFVFLTTLIAWLREAQGRPEYQLLLNEILTGAQDEKD